MKLSSVPPFCGERLSSSYPLLAPEILEEIWRHHKTCVGFLFGGDSLFSSLPYSHLEHQKVLMPFAW